MCHHDYAADMATNVAESSMSLVFMYSNGNKIIRDGTFLKGDINNRTKGGGGRRQCMISKIYHLNWDRLSESGYKSLRLKWQSQHYIFASHFLCRNHFSAFFFTLYICIKIPRLPRLGRQAVVGATTLHDPHFTIPIPAPIYPS